jgi:hypothetical protein
MGSNEEASEPPCCDCRNPFKEVLLHVITLSCFPCLCSAAALKWGECGRMSACCMIPPRLCGCCGQAHAAVAPLDEPNAASKGANAFETTIRTTSALSD